LTLVSTIEHVKPLAHIWVSSIRVRAWDFGGHELVGTWTVVHTGQRVVVTHPGGAMQSFVHPPRTTVQRDNMLWEEYNLGGSARFIHLSPFALWNLRFQLRDKQGMKDGVIPVANVEVAFAGTFLPGTVS